MNIMDIILLNVLQYLCQMCFAEIVLKKEKVK